MPVKEQQRGSKKLHKLLCDFVTTDHPKTTTEIWTELGKSKTHIVRAMKYLASRGYFTTKTQNRFQIILWVRTDKEFIYEEKVKKQPKPKVIVKPVCKKPKTPEKPVKTIKPAPVKTVDITIKPDLAAMWLVSSKPQWETRSIPIVRSIGLGAKRGTF